MNTCRIFLAVNTMVLVTLFSAAKPVSADVYVPPGLSAGDTYQIMFVTQATHDAQSLDIAIYDDFVHQQADLNSNLMGTDIGVTYEVLGSTFTVDAKDHAFVSAPIYMVDGSKIADGFDDLWDGSLDNPINRDQFGNLIADAEVYTGTFNNGTRWICPPDFIIDYTLGALFPRYGLTSLTDESWTGVREDFNFQQRHFWGLSSPITVPGNSVPEPSSGILFVGILLLASQRRRRRAV